MKDLKSLGVVHDPDQRVTRWGFELRAKVGSHELTLLNVRLKSGCFQGAISPSSSNPNCPTLVKELDPLKEWIEETRQAGLDFVILGDFNRRLDLESNQPLPTNLWDRMEGAADSAGFCIQYLELHGVSVRVLAYNKRAIRSYQKCGFTIKGRERETAFVDGKWHDDVIVALLDREFVPGSAFPPKA